jgi:hypothetical protein
MHKKRDDRIEEELITLRQRAKTISALGGNTMHINEDLGRLWVSVKATKYTIETWHRGSLQGTLANLL